MTASSRTQLAIAAGLLLAFAAAAYWLPIRPLLQSLLEWVRGMGAWGPVLLAAAYVIATVCFVPGSLMTLGAGFLFGVLVGAVTVSLASVVGASAAFWLGRTIARGWVERRFSGDRRFLALDRAIEREGFKIVLLVRLSPVIPFTAINYAVGLTKISYRDFLLASWIGMLPGTILYAYLGSTLQSLAELGSGAAAGGPVSHVPGRLALIGFLKTFCAGYVVHWPASFTNSARFLASGDGFIVYSGRSVYHGCPNRGTINGLAQLLGVQPRISEWRRKIDQAYALSDGQDLKRMPPPFLPERAELLLDGPFALREATFKFVQSGHGASLRSLWSRQQLTLAGVLEFVIGLERYEFEGPAELLSREVPGDWTVREAASRAKRLAALQDVLRDELELPVRFVQREVEREVLVASGRYEFLPLPGVRDREHIFLAIEEAPTTTMGGGGSGSLGDLLRWLGGRLTRPVIDETDGAKGQTLRWRDHLVSHTLDFANRTEAGRQKLDRLLFNLNQQTALRFTLEPRNVKVWFVEQAADGNDGK